MLPRTRNDSTIFVLIVCNQSNITDLASIHFLYKIKWKIQIVRHSLCGWMIHSNGIKHLLHFGDQSCKQRIKIFHHHIIYTATPWKLHTIENQNWQNNPWHIYFWTCMNHNRNILLTCIANFWCDGGSNASRIGGNKIYLPTSFQSKRHTTKSNECNEVRNILNFLN